MPDVYVNFHNSGNPAVITDTTINNFSSVGVGQVSADLLDEDGNASGISLDSSHSLTMTTVGGAGPHGATAVAQAFNAAGGYKGSANESLVFTVTVPSNVTSVDVECFLNQSYGGQDIDFDVNGQTLTAVDTYHGNSNGATYLFTNVVPDGNNQIVISYTDTDPSSSYYIFANGLVLSNIVTGAANNPPTGSLAITGTETENETLTMDTSGISDADGLGAFSYRWLRDSVAISGATASTYTLVSADVGAVITAEVSYTDGGGTTETLTADTGAIQAAASNSAPTGSLVITGAEYENETLTMDASGIADADGLGTFAYRWLRDGSPIAGETATTYTLVSADVGTVITAEVSYTDGGGTVETVTANTGTIQAAGTNVAYAVDDDFSTDGALGPHWNTYNAADIPDVSISGGYVVGNIENTGTTWYYGGKGRFDNQRVQIPYGSTPNEYILHDVGVALQSNPTGNLPTGNGDYVFAGLMVHHDTLGLVNDGSSANYMFTVIGYWGGTNPTLESKSTVDGSSSVNTEGSANLTVLGNGVTRADIAVEVYSDGSCRFKYRPANSTDAWTYIQRQGSANGYTPEPRPNLGSAGDFVRVGFIGYDDTNSRLGDIAWSVGGFSANEQNDIEQIQADDLAVSTTVDQVQVTQTVSTSVEDLTGSTTVDQVQVTQTVSTSVEDLTGSIVIDSASINVTHNTQVNDATIQVSVDQVDVTQHVVVGVSDMVSGTSLDTVDVNVTNGNVTIQVNGVTSSSTLDSVTVTQHVTAQVDDMSVPVTLDSVATSGAGTLGVNDVTINTVLDSASIQVQHVAEVNPLLVEGQLDQVEVEITVNAQVDDVIIPLTIDSVHAGTFGFRSIYPKFIQVKSLTPQIIVNSLTT